MWLKVSRYFIFILSILSHGILGTLATGNLIFGGLTGVDLSINAFVCLLGMSLAIFMMIIILVELNQMDATTTTLLFESIWVGLLWTTNAIGASFISKSTPATCLQPHHMNWKWDVCVTYSLLVPASWISATIVTAHLLVLIVLVQWHRSRSSARPRPNTNVASPKIWDRFMDLLRDEAFIMGPILDQSVYALLQIRSITEVDERSFNKRQRALAPSNSSGLGKKKVDRNLEEGVDFSTMAIPSPYSDAPPAYLSPPPTRGHARFDSIPDSLLSPIVAMYVEDYGIAKIQLRDEPSFEMLTVPQAAQPPLRTQLGGARTRNSRPSPLATPFAPPSIGRAFAPSPSPTSPRFPTRSRTLPSSLRLATPPPVVYSDGDTMSHRHPALSRSRTIAGTRRMIPSRYGQIDLVAAGYIDRMSVGSLNPPRPLF